MSACCHCLHLVIHSHTSMHHCELWLAKASWFFPFFFELSSFEALNGEIFSSQFSRLQFFNLCVLDDKVIYFNNPLQVTSAMVSLHLSNIFIEMCLIISTNSFAFRKTLNYPIFLRIFTSFTINVCLMPLHTFCHTLTHINAPSSTVIGSGNVAFSLSVSKLSSFEALGGQIFSSRFSRLHFFNLCVI